MIITATVSDIFSGQTNSSILVEYIVLVHTSTRFLNFRYPSDLMHLICFIFQYSKIKL